MLAGLGACLFVFNWVLHLEPLYQISGVFLCGYLLGLVSRS
jgi:hypothetical protein